MDKKLFVPEPKKGAVTLQLPREGEVLPLVKCDAELNLLCGNCGSISVEGIMENQNILIQCPVCGSYNEIL